MRDFPKKIADLTVMVVKKEIKERELLKALRHKKRIGCGAVRFHDLNFEL